jgi:hypothetical protein
MRARLPRVAAAAVVLLAFAGPAFAATPSKTAREVQMKTVVREWSKRLNANDNAGVAKLFAIPSVVIQGPYGYRFHTREQVAIWHSALPCAGKIVSVTIHGRYADTVFRLANRGKTKCDAPGTLAAARFEIVKGKIVSWIQIPVPEQKDDSALVA